MEECNGVIIKKDGDSWFAIREDFINLVESLCGFGETELEALEDLLHVETTTSEDE